MNPILLHKQFKLVKTQVTFGKRNLEFLHTQPQNRIPILHQ